MSSTQISKVSGPSTASDGAAGGVAAAKAVLGDTSGTVGLQQQLTAFHALSNRWAGAGHDERVGLTWALNESPFAKTVQSALNTFTRTAWAGTDAVPPEPQIRMKAAFEGLSETDQTIVASLNVGMPRAAPASVEDYRASLQKAVEAVQPAARGQDTVTLSPEAQAILAGDAAPSPPDAAPTPAATPDLAAALTAYGKAAG
ncbi:MULTISPECIES: hypothetical protein [unclassified Caulobacter]|uniref:hypothetical protein n=1 Tax=unclassified Caulobacter TaxID=2648921 RepID=UPI000D3B7099|nr:MULTISPECIES: hypothetical protein [unclassified Caulobacter]PTS89327.1 hypothetical protein DBR21_06875 [Caulobacter sp. HMWF009]PTT11099.1 hypothetical protein DBR10_04340 [Caulobacter sp. HMWF025]